MGTPTPRRRILIPGILLALLLLAAFATFSRALDTMMDGVCGSTEITRLTSPDGRQDAVLFEHDCGATTDFATHVSVLPAGTELGSDGGNAFAAGVSDSGSRADWGGPPVELEWQPDGALVINYDGSTEVFFRATSVEGVDIRSGSMP